MGAFVSAGHNLIGNVGSATGFTNGVNDDQVGGGGNPVIDPLLGPLADNGGPTQTRAPLANSSVIDAADNTDVSSTDQRGAPRILDGDSDGTVIADIGAVEYFSGFLVDSTEDTVDANPGDGVAEDAAGNTTLRAAVMEANALAGQQMIVVPAGQYHLALGGAVEDEEKGDLDLTDDVVLVGAGMDATVVDGNGLDRVLHIASGVTAKVHDVSLTGGFVDHGGAILNAGESLILDSVLLAGNEVGGYGAGVYNSEGSELIIRNSVVSDNVSGYGGVVANYGSLVVSKSVFDQNTGSAMQNWCTANVTETTFSGNAGAYGAGLYNHGTATVSSSTFSGNLTGTQGGAIYNVDGTLEITNSTISGNTSSSSGALYNHSAGTTVVIGCTIVSNTGGGAGANYQAMQVKDTIIANNANGADLSGLFVSLGHNLIGNGDGGSGFTNGVNGDLVGTSGTPVDPLLGPLQDNGGPTLTHAPLANSPAIDAGDNTDVSSTDQRGVPRILDGDGDSTATVDIGAVEYFDGFVVNSTADTVDAHPGDGLAEDSSGNTTLRAAIMEANALAGDQTIILPAGTYTLAIAGTGEDAAATGDLDITDTSGRLVIFGLGAGSTIVDADGIDRVFHVLNGTSLSLTDITVSGGDATVAGAFNGGAILGEGPLSIRDSILSANTAYDGGAVYSNATTIVGTTFSGNNAGHYGGAVYHNGGTLAITDSSFTSNSADEQGGALLANSLTATVADSSFTGNSAPNAGGAIRGMDSNLTITRTSIVNNSANGGTGGAIKVHGNGTSFLTIVDSTISGNQAGRPEPWSEGGGAIQNDVGGTLTITGSTLSGNTLTGSAHGGAVWNAGALTVSNTTISGNSTGLQGGGIYSNSSFAVSIGSSTIYDNDSQQGGGIAVLGTGSVEIQNTIIAGNTATSSNADVSGVFTSQGHNLIGDIGSATGFTNGVNGDQVGGAGNPVIDPRLGALADNDGPTQTHAPLSDSPAIDAGDNIGVSTADQRGAPRVLDGDGDSTATVDVGAVEYFVGFLVESTDDTVDATPGDGTVADSSGNSTLRAGIMEANARAGDDTIAVGPGTYTLRLLGTEEDGGATGDLDITDTTGSLTILGAGAGITIIDANEIDRVLHILAGAELTLSGVTITGGHAVFVDGTTGRGGGITSFGSLTITDSEITSNRADYGGGGIRSNQGSLTITDSVVSNNISGDYGGGIWNNSPSTAVLTNTTVSGNLSSSYGGGIFNEAEMTITNSTITGNTAEVSISGHGGGGIANYTGATLQIVDCTISDNEVTGAGGGVLNDGGTLQISGSTIANNTASYGGGITNKSGTMTVTNSTISGNTVSGEGGGISFNAASTSGTITFTTISDNFAASGFHGITSGSAALQLGNTIVAGHQDQTSGPELNGTFTSLGNNLIGDVGTATGFTDGVNGDQVGGGGNPVIDPLLGPLADNGEPTWTHALLPGSPAIDGGNNSGAPAVDQRGEPRPHDGNGDGTATVDIGAYEFWDTYDYGDAPAPYPTTFAQDGARHTPTGPKLGQDRGWEDNGRPSANADGDDTIGGDDEDGVTFAPSIMVGQLGVSVVAEVWDAFDGARLDAWIDFDGDGNWGGPGEHIADSLAVGSGDNTITFDVPSWARAGTTYARFRLSTAGNLGIGGLAADGEVEDYAVTIASPTSSTGEFTGAQVIGSTGDSAEVVLAADLDRDGDLDVLAAFQADDRIAWYENDGSEGFTEHTISTAADRPVSVVAVDLDGDGDLDVLSGSANDDKVAWYENDGSQSFTAHVITSSANEVLRQVSAADMDGDGDMDVVATACEDNTIFWYENDGSQGFTERVITAAAPRPYSVAVADVDGDGDLDLVAALNFANTVAWYENDGSQSFTERVISTYHNGPTYVATADVNRDGHLDVLVASQYDDKIAWHENDGSQQFTQHVVSTAADNARMVLAADLDGDGDIDLLGASENDNTVAWYANDGSQNFIEQLISTSAQGARSIHAADVDGDGDLDVLSASATDDKIAWYRNMGHAPVLAAIGNKSINEGVQLSFMVTATDSDAADSLSFSLDPGAPAGAQIDASTGVFNWTPTEAQGPGSYQLTIRVTDDGSPAQSDSERITVTVGEVNNYAPVLAAIGNKTVTEGSQLTFTASATDGDQPTTLSYGLDPGAPTGAFINATTGVFSWTPTEAQGPGNYQITVRVTDSGAPSKSDSETITVTVGESNQAPVLVTIGNKTVKEGSTLTFAANATDADTPANTLTFSLDAGAPAGASIHPTTGVFTWTPGEADGPGDHSITVRVTDNGTPALADWETIIITVEEVNQAPVLSAIGNKTVSEGSALTFTASASDPDMPENTLTYSLVGDVPAGASIDPANGAFSWTPSESQGPGSYQVTVRVTDDGTPTFYDSETFTITVVEQNQAPQLTDIGDRAVDENTQLAFTVHATDTDDPENSLAYSLDPGAPLGASINAETGLFRWTPGEADGPGTYSITVRVTDNGTPSLDDWETITVTVNEINAAPVLAAIDDQTVEVDHALTFTASATDSDEPANTLSYSLGAGAPVGASIDSSTGVFSWTPDTVGEYYVTVLVADDGTPAKSDFQAITILVGAGNHAPELSPISNQSVNEGNQLTVAASATDADADDKLSFSLGVGAPAGASIDAESGIFTWTPSEAQGPGSHLVTIRVTDDGSPPLSVSKTFTVTVAEVNQWPELASIGSKNVAEGVALTFTAVATDADLPANTLTFALDPGAPTGAAINPTTGVFTWTPAETDGPATYSITVRVTDDGSPARSDSETIVVTVSEANQAPVLAAIGDKAVNEEVELTFTASAVDSDYPENTLTYSLDAGTPPGATIDPATGVFRWTPTEAQGPGSYTFTVRVTDDGTPAKDDVETIVVTVGELNQAPVLDAITDQMIGEGAQLRLTVTATDADYPENTLVYTLGSDAPQGASIDSATGELTWTPTEAQSSRTHQITVRVTDDGGLYDEATFQVGVFQILASTGEEGFNPLSFVRLQVPSSQQFITPAGFNAALDVDRKGTIYGAGSLLRILDPNTGEVTVVGSLHTTEDYEVCVRGITFSPDDTLFAVAEDSRALYTIDPQTALVTPVPGLVNVDVRGIEFGPDGTLYAVGVSATSGEARLYTLDPASGERQTDVGTLAEEMNDIDFAADGFLYGVGQDNRKLYRIDPADATCSELGTFASSLQGLVIQKESPWDGDYAEPNDTLEEAYDLRSVVGQLVVRPLSIHEAYNDDWFRFQIVQPGTQGHFVRIAFDHEQGDLDLYLYKAGSGQVIGQSATNGDREQISLQGQLAGTYFIRVLGFAEATNPSYKLVISAPDSPVADVAEPNDSQEAARNLGLLKGPYVLPDLSIHLPNNDDWFRFTTSDEGTAAHCANIEFIHTAGNLDLQLYDTEGNVIASSRGATDTERISFDGLPAGTYDVRVFGASGAINASYTLSLNTPELGLPDYREFNDTIGEATDLTAVRGQLTLPALSIHQSTDEDWFQFELVRQAASNHFVETAFRHDLGDLDLFVYDGTGQLLEESIGAGDGERINLAGLPAGTYYVQVAGYLTATNPYYDLTMAVPESPVQADRLESNDDFGEATLLVMSKGKVLEPDLTIHDDQDVDVFRFQLNSRATAADFAAIEFERIAGELQLELLDHEQNPVAGQPQTDAPGFRSISLAGLDAGDYFLRASGVAGATNQYDLKINATTEADDWTILVYMTASDLAGRAKNDLEELELALSRLPESVNIAVFLDQSQSKPFATPVNGGSNAPWGETGQAFLVPDTDMTAIATSFELLEEKDSGDPDTLRDFVDWATDSRPAANYALVLWGHGLGVFGSNFDNYDPDPSPDPLERLSIDDLRQAIGESHVGYFELIAYDASLMGMAEVMDTLTPCTDVLVASAQVGETQGFAYDEALAVLEVDPGSVTAATLGVELVNSYQRRYLGRSTLTAFELADATALTDALYEFSEAVVGVSGDPTHPGATVTDFEAIGVARSVAHKFGLSTFRDLGIFMETVATNPQVTTSIRTAAQHVHDALRSTVLAEATDPARVSGLTIYFPDDISTADAIDYMTLYQDFDQATRWFDFLEAFANAATGKSGDAVPDYYDSQGRRNNSLATAHDFGTLQGNCPFTDLTIHQATDVDWYRFTISDTGGPGNHVAISYEIVDDTTQMQLVLVRGASQIGTPDQFEQMGDIRYGEISLDGLDPGEYLIKVAANGVVRSYQLEIDSPTTGIVHSAAGNSTRDKARELSGIGGYPIFTGYVLQSSHWYRFDGPNTLYRTPIVLKTIMESNAENAIVQVTLEDAQGSEIVSSSHNERIAFERTYAPETYYLHISTNSSVPISYRIEFAPAAGVSVSPVAGLTTTESGDTATFEVVLNSEPSANVEIGLSSNDNSEGTVSTSKLTFTPGNWNVIQTVTVTGVNDEVDDGNVAYTVVTTAAGSADTAYSGLQVADVALTNVDDGDAAGITVEPAGDLTTSEEGDHATFSVVLNSQPTADVMIDLVTSDDSEGIPSLTSLTFDPIHWNMPQSVTVSGVDDDVDDGDVPYSIITLPAASADPNYDGRNAADVSLTNQNDGDTAGFTVSATSLTTSETGDQATFTIVLTSEPTGRVTIDLDGNDPSEGELSATSLSFEPTNWSIPQTVTVTGVDDQIDDDDVAYTIVTNASSTDTKYDTLDPADITVTNTDDIDTAGITVSPTSGPTTSELGGMVTFTVVLESEPTADVNISLTSTKLGEGVVALTSLTFTSDDWDTVQTVTVTGVDDQIDDGDVEYTILATASSADTKYNVLDPADVTLTNQDDDTAGIRVLPTTGLTTSEAGAKATFTVVLLSEPTAEVTIDLSSDDASEGTPSLNSLTFTPDDWDTPQSITVTGVDDQIDDGDVEYTIVTTASSADTKYDVLDPDDVTLINQDDDTAGITVSPTSGLTTSESGDQATFTIVLQSEPTAEVTIDLRSDDTSEGTPSLTSLAFTPDNWDTPQTITVTGVDDQIDDGNVFYTIITDPADSADANYDGRDSQDVSLMNADDGDRAGIVVSATPGLTTSESGDQATFTIVLQSEPTAAVTIGLSSNDPSEGMPSLTGLTFTPGNWSTPQTITVTGVDDHIDDDDVSYAITTLKADSDDPKYDGRDVDDISLTNTDDGDKAGISVSPTSGLLTSEPSGRETFTVVLDSEPTADVTIGLSSSDPTEGMLSLNSLTFTPGNWNTPQTVTVTGVDDQIDDGSVPYTIDTTVSSADTKYNTLDPPDVSVINANDGDKAGITVSATSVLMTSEPNGQATFTVVLNSQPTANVTIGLSSSDAGEGTLSLASLTFTPGNWQTAQTVTVTGVDDQIDDDNVSYSIITAAATSNDPKYAGLDAADVMLSNANDDDTAGISVSATSGLITTEEGGQATFTIVLDTQPLGSVVIALNSSDPGEGIASPTTLTFTPSDWNLAQTVTVTGQNDSIDDGDATYTIGTEPASSSDPKYNSRVVADVVVTNQDDADTAGVTVSPTSGLVTSEEGGQAAFTVFLDSEPTANVIIGLSSSDPSEGVASPAYLTFKPSNWNTPQLVTVSGVNDDVDDDDVAYTIITSAAASNDPNFDGRDVADVSIVNTETDEASLIVTPTTGLTTTEAGGQTLFAVRLATRPVSTVVIDLSVSDASEGSVAPDSLTFTPDDWNEVQFAFVNGVDDSLDDDNVSYHVAVAVSSSQDPKYSVLPPTNLAVTNVDNDVAQVRVASTSGLRTTENGRYRDIYDRAGYRADRQRDGYARVQ